jgi:hypothetical protein
LSERKNATNDIYTTVDILKQNLVVVEETVVPFLINQDLGRFPKWYPVGIEEDEGTWKGKLGGGKFDWMPIATKAAPAKAFDLHDCKVQQVSGHELKNEPEMVNKERQRDQTEVLNKDDFYDNLEAVKEGNSKLENGMVVRLLEEFEDVEHQRENTKLEDEMMDKRRK